LDKLTTTQQVVAGHAQDIAKNYTGLSSSVYQTAADNLRLPFWDWASIPQMPDVVSQPTVTITTPDGDQQVDNPLFTYKFHQFPLNTTLFPGGGLATSPQTYRSDTANQDLQNANLMSRTVSHFANEECDERKANWLIVVYFSQIKKLQLICNLSN
jgi:tyrosinase